MSRETTLLYVHNESIGYGRLGMRLAEQFAARGIDVYDGIEPPEGVKGQLSSGDRKVNEGRRSKRTNSIGWVSVPTHAKGWYEGQVPWIFTMWEADWLPEAFRESLHHFDTILVPSPQNVDLFSTYHPNVHLATLGIDPTVWHHVERTPPTDYFDVLVGGSGARKGVDVALEAFGKAFPPGSWGDGPIPRLVLKSPRSDFGFPDEHAAALTFPPDEQLLVIKGRITPEEEVALYARSHVYLQPSRGEGFGLQPLQAIAQGLPTVLTDAHGHESFAHLGWPVGFDMVPAGYFIYGGHPDMKWWEPKVDDIVDHLRFIYADYEGATALAARCSQAALQAFKWSDCADQVLDAVGDSMDEPYTGSGEWVNPTPNRYLVRVNRFWQADIAGLQYRFEPGRDYYEHSDVKRILFEAEVLDPSCLDRVHTTEGHGDQFDDSGLTQAQAEQIVGYTAAHSFCPECRQPLNNAPTRADLLWALQRAQRGDDLDEVMAELAQAQPPRMEVAA